MYGIEIETRQAGRWSVVAVSGELDIDGLDQLRSALAEGIDQADRSGQAPRLLVDFSRLEFCDATGLGVLVAARKAVDRRGGTMRVVCQGVMRRLLGITGLDRGIPVFHTVEDALADDGQRAAESAPRRTPLVVGGSWDRRAQPGHA